VWASVGEEKSDTIDRIKGRRKHSSRKGWSRKSAVVVGRDEDEDVKCVGGRKHAE